MKGQFSGGGAIGNPPTGNITSAKMFNVPLSWGTATTSSASAIVPSYMDMVSMKGLFFDERAICAIPPAAPTPTNPMLWLDRRVQEMRVRL